MDWQDRISVDPNVLVGKLVIEGTRIAVEFVVDLLGRGWTTEQILHEYDYLTAEDIQACQAYASGDKWDTAGMTEFLGRSGQG